MQARIVHGGGVAAAAARYGGAPADWLDLSTGLNPVPPAIPAIPDAVWHRLPDADLLLRARQAAAAFYGSAHCLPLAVPGTQAAIQHLPALVPPGCRAVVLGPTYGEYRRVLEAARLPVVEIDDLSEVPDDAGLLVVVNPNNPTGRVVPRTTLLALAGRMAAAGGHLVVDEAFADVSPNESLAGVAGREDGLIVFRSFGKVFGLAGLRLGFVLGPAAVLEGLGEALGPWAVSGPALSVAAALMPADPAPLRAAIAARRRDLDAVLAEAGLPVVGGTALFSLIAVPDAAGLHDHLCRQRILARRFDYAPDWLRLGLAPDARGDARLAAALAAWPAARTAR